MSKRIVILNTSFPDHTVVAYLNYNPGLDRKENLLLAAATTQIEHCGLSSINKYCDGMRVYPYKIEYTKKGNIKYAGQKLIDGTNPLIYTIVIEESPE